MTSNKVIAVAAGMLLIASSGFAQTKTKTETKAPAKAAAAAPKAAAKPVDHTTTGTIKSADASKLVLTTKKGDVSFNLGTGTTKTGDMAPGGKATVHYHVEGGQNMATSVSVAAPKAPAAAKPAASKTKAK